MSLAGLNSIIQLQAAILEGQRQTTTNNNQVNSSVQQQGLQQPQASSSKSELKQEKIQAEYAKALQSIRLSK